jgi:hypothetical protein
MRRKRHTIEDLRRAIDCLPVDTRMAMLAGVRSNDIIAGAYTDRSGGVCPMLAAHRCGGRTSLISFAHAWDRFARAKRARRATEREVRILIAHLEASLLAEHRPDLERAIVEHRAALERAAAEHGVSMAGMALAWLLGEPRLTSVVVGPTKPAHLEPVREALGLRLGDDERAAIGSLFA